MRTGTHMNNIVDISDKHKDYITNLEQSILYVKNRLICNDLSGDDKQHISYICNTLDTILSDKDIKETVVSSEKWARKMINVHGDDVEAVKNEAKKEWGIYD